MVSCVLASTTLGVIIWRARKEAKLHLALERLRSDTLSLLGEVAPAVEAALSAVCDTLQNHFKAASEENTKLVGGLGATMKELASEIRLASEQANQSLLSSFGQTGAGIEKQVSEMRGLIEKKMQIALEKILEEFYRVQAERLSLIAQRGEFMQLGETLERVHGTLAEATTVLEAAAKKGRAINDNLAKGQPGIPESNVVAFGRAK